MIQISSNENTQTFFPMTTDFIMPPTPKWRSLLFEKADESINAMLASERGIWDHCDRIGYPYKREHSKADLVDILWQNADIRPHPVDPTLTEWLVETATSDGSAEHLATYALNATIVGIPDKLRVPSMRNPDYFPEHYRPEDRGKHEALRILVRAAALCPPENHGSLWQLKPTESVFEGWDKRMDIFEILTAGWTALQPMADYTKPTMACITPLANGWELFKNMVIDHPLGEHAKLGNKLQDVFMQAAYLGWKAGEWTPETQLELLDACNFLHHPHISSYSGPDDLAAFLHFYHQTSRLALDLMIQAGRLEWTSLKLGDIDPTLPAIDVVMKVGRAIEEGQDPKPMVGLIRSLKVSAEDRAPHIKRLKELDPRVLSGLLMERSAWIPLILDAFPDQKIAEILKITIGTFSETEWPEGCWGGSHYSSPYPELHPGRVSCGYTDMGPFLDMLQKAPIAKIKKALPILRQSRACDERAVAYIVHHLDLPKGRMDEALFKGSSAIALSKRISKDTKDRDELLRDRAGNFVLAYHDSQARTTVSSEPFFPALLNPMYPHAESAGFETAEDALWSMAGYWMECPTLEAEGVTLTKSHHLPEGLTVQKGNRVLKDIPQTLKKHSEVMLFRAEAFALWQSRLIMEQRAIQEFVQSGEFPENPAFTGIFGVSVSDTLRRRLATPVPEKLETEIREILERKGDTPVDLKSISPVIPHETFPELVRRGWEHIYGRWSYEGIHSMYGGGGGLVMVLGVKQVKPNAEPIQGSTPPKTLHTLQVQFDSICGPANATPAGDERVLRLILGDLVAAFREGRPW
jgi:hypothetical protein